MRALLTQFQAVANHPDAPLELSVEHWKKILKPYRISFDNLPDLLTKYLTQGLFEKSLPLTFDLYSAPQLQKAITGDVWFPAAVKGGWFIIGDRDGDFVCVSRKDGEVALIPGWSISEKIFEREEIHESLETFFAAQLKHEQGVAERRVQQKKADAEFAVSTDPNVLDSKGHTTLMNSVGDLEAMRRELDAGAKPNIRSKRRKETALNLAVEKQHFEGVELLLNYRPKKFKTNVDNKCKNGATPLSAAIEKGNFEIVKLLVGAGADLEKKAFRDQNPLYEAVDRELIEIAEYLLEKGANPNSSSGEGDITPLRIAVGHSVTNKAMMLKVLLRHGADPNVVKTQRPLAQLHWLNEEALPILKIFLEVKGINLNDPRDGLLHLAKSPEWVTLLCEADADPNMENKDGALPLMRALAFPEDALEKAKILLNHGADLNLVGSGRYNETSLGFVTRCKFFEGMEFLLEHGADPHIPAKNDAFKIAKKITNKQMSKRALRILEKAVADS